jgi:hypothetical protein
MGKVIDIVTRKEVTELPASKQDGEKLIEHMLRLELRRSSVNVGPVELISNLISMIENNTGASRYEVMDRIYNKRSV